MFYIIYGHDSYSRQQEFEEIRAGLDNAEMLATNTSVLNGHQLNLEQLKEVCNTVPFLHSVRLAVVEGLLERFEPNRSVGRQAGQTRIKSTSELKEWQSLGSYIKEMPPTTILILIDGIITSRNPLLKHLISLAKIKTFPMLRGKNLENWIQKRVIQSGGTVSLEAIELLAGFIGGDLWAMSSEVDKLLAYRKGHLITANDVKQLTSYSREANVFALVDAILENRIGVAQKLLHQLLQEGMSPSFILTMITRQLRLIVRAQGLRKTLSPPKVRDRLELASNYPINKLLEQAKAYKLEQIRTAYHKVLETDIAIKTGRYDGYLAIDLLIIELFQTNHMLDRSYIDPFSNYDSSFSYPFDKS